MRKHLNTLYVTLDGAYLHKEGKAIEVKHSGDTKLRVPLHNLESIVSFGWNTTASAALMHGCAQAGVGLSFFSPTGRFLASSYGGVSGNVLLRKDQYRTSESQVETLALAKQIITAKIANSRTTLQRAIRDGKTDAELHESDSKLGTHVDYLKHRIRFVKDAPDLDSLRGVEGEAALIYFSCFNELVMEEGFCFEGRTRNPPMDPLNALLSFLYVILMHDCKSACEGVGLDPQCGFLHRDRPGRFSLALDIAEEFRSYLVDRLVFALINRKQITTDDFEFQESGAVLLKEDSRKKVLSAWQERKNDELEHSFLKETNYRGIAPSYSGKTARKTPSWGH